MPTQSVLFYQSCFATLYSSEEKNYEHKTTANRNGACLPLSPVLHRLGSELSLVLFPTKVQQSLRVKLLRMGK